MGGLSEERTKLVTKMIHTFVSKNEDRTKGEVLERELLAWLLQGVGHKAGRHIYYLPWNLSSAAATGAVSTLSTCGFCKICYQSSSSLELIAVSFT